MTEQPATSQDPAQSGWHTAPIGANSTSTAISIGAPGNRTTKEFACPECGEHVQRHMEKCPACGGNLRQPPKPIRCMHCHTTASSELVVCPGCGRELQEAPPKVLTYGAPLVVALLLVALLATQWERVSPIAWVRANLSRGVVLVEDLSASIEPEMVIVMTPIVEEVANSAPGAPLVTTPSTSPDTSLGIAASSGNENNLSNVGESNVAVNPDPNASDPNASDPNGTGVAAASVIVSDTQAVALVAQSDATPVPPGESAQDGALATTAAAVQSPVGVGGPQLVEPAAQAAVVEQAMPTLTPAVTDTPLPTATAPESTETNPPDEGEAVALAAAAPTMTPTPTWTPLATLVIDTSPARNSVEGATTSTPAAKISGGGMAQMAALAADNDADEAADNAARDENLSPTATMSATPTTASAILIATATPLVYQVRAGDTLVTIAATYDVDVDALMEANEIGAQDVFVIQPGQMLYIPTPTPEPLSPNVRVEAPLLLTPPDDANVSCATGGTLMWQRVQFVKDSDEYMLHLGFVSGPGSNGEEDVTWVVSQRGPVTQTEWQLDTSLCELATDEYDREWRWWVEVVDSTGDEPVAVSPASEVHSFTWQ